MTTRERDALLECDCANVSKCAHAKGRLFCAEIKLASAKSFYLQLGIEIRREQKCIKNSHWLKIVRIWFLKSSFILINFLSNFRLLLKFMDFMHIIFNIFICLFVISKYVHNRGFATLRRYFEIFRNFSSIEKISEIYRSMREWADCWCCRFEVLLLSSRCSRARR